MDAALRTGYSCWTCIPSLLTPAHSVRHSQCESHITAIVACHSRDFGVHCSACGTVAIFKKLADLPETVAQTYWLGVPDRSSYRLDLVYSSLATRGGRTRVAGRIPRPRCRLDHDHLAGTAHCGKSAV